MEILNRLYGLIWGAPALILILGVGIALTLRTGFAQVRLFPAACRAFGRRLTGREDNGSGSFQALCTALAATVGTGNLAGVAGAIAIGGPGALFWMWCCGILGMMIKFGEAALSVRYSVPDEKGGRLGGPMYMIRQGLGPKWAWLGSMYCFFGVAAAFGVGNATQVNAVIGGFHQALQALGGSGSEELDLLLGLILGVLVTAVLLGGASRIGRIAEYMVPVAAGAYILLGAGFLILRAEAIPGAFASIIQGAFTPAAVTGGVVSSAFLTLRTGVSRGVFTNEAGMGTAGMAHGSASVAHPVEQGLMGIVEVFLDTIVICTVTGLVILCSGISIPYGTDPGVALTTGAFSTVYGPLASVMIAGALCCFAFATMLGWGLYGSRCAQYLLGEGAWKWFALLQGGVVVLGAAIRTETAWLLSELFNGLMAIPNLIALAALTPELVRLVREYSSRPYCKVHRFFSIRNKRNRQNNN